MPGLEFPQAGHNEEEMESGEGRMRLDALTGLRYVAALCVLLEHLAAFIPDSFLRKRIINLGGVGMPVFFVLSGFLMSYNYSAAFRASYLATLRKFYIARFCRIYPIYVIALLISFAFCGNVCRDLSESPRETAIRLAFMGTVTQSWVEIPVSTDFTNPRPVWASYLHVAWSVSTEAFFYLSFPLFVLPIARVVTSGRRLLFACGAIYSVYLAYNASIAHLWIEECAQPDFLYSRTFWGFYICPYIRLGEFLIGASVGQFYLISQNRNVSSFRAVQAWRLLIASSIAATFTTNFYFNHLGQGPLWLIVSSKNVLFAPLCAIAIYYLAAMPSLPQRVLAARPLVLLGESSYCLYLLHMIVLTLCRNFTLGEPGSTSTPSMIFNILTILVCLHYLSLGLYRYAEAPLRSFLRGLLEARPKPPAKEQTRDNPVPLRIAS